ncbi:uncharacterized protein EI90DRAFT_3042311 [Cantharellus anzutake]|uniref:uncharacterized protein n=1 Tax=Cantharellus anzutake TaxID=1750568 RepID=UPI001904C0A1|nr:uncharacterized protein EI90DRAFT_3042311 [Cantharellus anzutake]KAF8338262.1 hypothetical protein EI90DRAFT_3042311 [Cantharellus anzutake]
MTYLVIHPNWALCTYVEGGKEQRKKGKRKSPTSSHHLIALREIPRRLQYICNTAFLQHRLPSTGTSGRVPANKQPIIMIYLHADQK